MHLIRMLWLLTFYFRATLIATYTMFLAVRLSSRRFQVHVNRFLPQRSALVPYSVSSPINMIVCPDPRSPLQAQGNISFDLRSNIKYL